MHHRTGVSTGLLFLALSAAPLAWGDDVVLNSPQWLGSLNLDDKALTGIKKAVEAAFTAPIDAEQQCAEVNLDCVVRAAREWDVGGVPYREIVINVHATGHTSHAVGKTGGKWPTVRTK